MTNLIRFAISVLLLMMLAFPTFADEPLEDFSDESLPIFNEEQRKTQYNVRNLEAGIYTVKTITADDTTPSVSGGKIFVTSINTTGTAITQFDDGKKGQIILVIGGSDTNNSTIADSGNFKLTGAMTLGATDTITLYYDGTYWIELSRTVN